MNRNALLSLIVLLAACAHPSQQPRVLSPIRVDSSAVGGAAPAAEPAAEVFRRLDRMDWPGPNESRASNGAPGHGYWQQRADYNIVATLDTTAHTITGRVTMRYTNNSPDTLRFLWLQLDQNLYRPGSKGSALFPDDSRFGVRGFHGGYNIHALSVNGKPATSHVDDTMMRVDMDTPLAARGGVATLVIDYDFAIAEHGSDRMGRDSTLYEIAQWYPRMSVYDDVRGWNTDPYLGQGEFYLEYGDIDYAVTVPAGYTVAGSGVLQNPAEVLTTQERSRLALAARSDTVVKVIGEAEAKVVPTPGTKTWRFRAERVRDVAWAAAPDFRWDATSWRGILCQAYYQWPKAGTEWEHAAENTQWTIRTYSEMLFPFPYPQATSVAGPVGGMEYPMFVMDGYADPRSPGEVFRVNDHEQGHEWFPMIVGSNERRYAWMDEGINTYINAFSQEKRYGSNPAAWPAGMDNIPSFLGGWRNAHSAGIDTPLMTMPDFIDTRALGTIGYRKPGAVLLALRNHVVGRETFDAGFREYVRRWAFKHPTPADFFRTVENQAGEDLSWFWRSFFYSTDVLDIGIDSVVTVAAEGGPQAVVVLSRRTSVPFPVELRLKLADGTTQDERFPVQIWTQGERVAVGVPVKTRVVGARLWPDGTVPDWNAGNDVWGDAPKGDSATPITLGGAGGVTSTRTGP